MPSSMPSFIVKGVVFYDLLIDDFQWIKGVLFSVLVSAGAALVKCEDLKNSSGALCPSVVPRDRTARLNTKKPFGLLCSSPNG